MYLAFCGGKWRPDRAPNTNPTPVSPSCSALQPPGGFQSLCEFCVCLKTNVAQWHAGRRLDSVLQTPYPQLIQILQQHLHFVSTSEEKPGTNLISGETAYANKGFQSQV